MNESVFVGISSFFAGVGAGLALAFMISGNLVYGLLACLAWAVVLILGYGRNPGWEIRREKK